MKAITNVATQIVPFVRQQSQVQDTGVTSNLIRAMRMIILLHLGRIQITMQGGKIITVHEILVLIVTKHIEIFFNSNIKSSYYTNETMRKHEQESRIHGSN
jgi:hypothetical protein